MRVPSGLFHLRYEGGFHPITVTGDRERYFRSIILRVIAG